MLLDTCVLQNIEWVWDQMEEEVEWTEERLAGLKNQFGAALANELLDLGYLVDYFQWEGGFPWLVSASARSEFERHEGSRRPGLLKGWNHLHGHQEDWAIDSFRGVAASVLVPAPDVRINPLVLRGLGVSSVDKIVADDGPLSEFPDPGDRALIRDGLLSGVPAILTTDLRTFWSRRELLYDFGIEVWRPSEALTAYIPKWAQDKEECSAVDTNQARANY